MSHLGHWQTFPKPKDTFKSRNRWRHGRPSARIYRKVATSFRLLCRSLPLLEFKIGSHPGDSTHYVNARDMLSLSLLQARLIDLGMPIKIVEDT
jgi:hypothetical protein